MERKLSKRQEWREHAKDLQDLLNEQLRLADESVEYYNLLLAAAFSDQDEERFEIIEAEVLHRLNSMWSFGDDVLRATGKWHMTKLDVVPGGIAVSRKHEEAFNSVPKSCFTVDKLESESTPRIFMRLMCGGLDIDTNEMTGKLRTHALADPKELTLTYLRPGNMDVISADMNDIFRSLEIADAALAAYIQDDRSSFYEQSAKKQQRFFNDIINAVEDTLPDIETEDALRVNNLNTPVVYVPRSPHSMDRLINPDRPFVLTGRVLGVTILETRVFNDGEKIGSIDDMIDSDAGVCLVIKPHKINFEIDILDNGTLPDLVVPYRTVHNLPLSLH